MTKKKDEKEKVHMNKISVVKLNCQIHLETDEPLDKAVEVFDELMKKHSKNK